MVTLLKPLRWMATFALLIAQLALAQDFPNESRHRLTLRGTSSLVAIDSPEVSWLDGGLGKLRYDESTSPAVFDRLLIQYRGTLSPTVFAHVDADVLDDGDSGLGLTEAFVEWRPVPRSRTRHRMKFGAFYPRSSLENVGPGWQSPYTISSSALNTWIAEEVRLLGAEWMVERRLGDAASAHHVSAFAAAFYGNDPSGALISWKGWGIHDRQTRWGEKIAFAPIPRLEPRVWPGQDPAEPGTVLSPNQAPVAEPFLEIDREPGYHAGAEWRYAQRLSISASRYDNRADPMSIADGQYGWRTIFDQVGVQISLPWNVGLLAQWMRGTTAMGPVLRNGRRPIDVDFESAYMMLTREFRTYRLSLRFDDFEAYDADLLPDDDNNETGDAITLAYIRELRDGLSLAVEWQRIDSQRPARAYLGLAPDSTEQMLRAQISWQLGSWPN